ncbi:GTP cyclohydrolase II RibA [Aurantimonas sp. A2-1-M11]|uniref:GTP cyclohydrolase II RibA n=1 Tax=Aurantimonas sp. A2-1-M11 TaxID=3113712 RepID=UPI002F9506BA
MTIHTNASAAQPASLALASFGPDAAIRCERAAAELRFGRPVRIVGTRGEALIALALDTATPATFQELAGTLGDRLHLYLTPQRARVLSIDAPGGAMVPLAGLDLDAACHLGYLRGALPPQGWRPANPLAAEAVGVARLALLLPALVCATVAADEPVFADCATIGVGDIDVALAATARRFQVVAETAVPLKGIDEARFVVFRGGFAQRDQIAIVVGQPDRSFPVPVRVHSSCITGDLFGSLKCDCGDQLRNGLKTLEARGGGVLLYLDQEGRGTGIAAKMRAYGLQAEGLDTIDADAELGFGADERRYETAAAMLDGLNIKRIDLLTNNPLKVAYLKACGIDVVDRTPVTGTVTAENRGYLRTKAERGGHMLAVDRLYGG